MMVADVETLTQLLEFRSVHDSHREAFFIEGRSWSYRELWEGARCFAGSLVSRGFEKRDRLVIALPNRATFFIGLFGCQIVGVIPVLACPDFSVRRLSRLAISCGARGVVVDDDAIQKAREGPDRESRRSADSVEFLTVDCRCAPPSKGGLPAVLGTDVAVVLMTSGSTGEARAVQLTHSNLLANLRIMIPRMRITSEDVFVSWLPTFHDMGLVLMALTPLYQGSRLSLLPVRSRPHIWLKAIEDFGGTIIASPDFGYRYCLQAVRRSSMYRLDTLRLALNAAEPVRETTIRSFEARFGLDRILVPAYGLAEATAGVSCCEPGSTIVTDKEGRVSAGRAFDGVAIKIGAAEETSGAGIQGEILVKSASNTIGYLEGDAVAGQPYDSDGFVRTGDRGYLDESGRLFVTGRIKDLIIQSGRSLAPGGIEEVVDEVDRVRYSAAVGIEMHSRSGEQVVVFAELRRPSSEGVDYEATSHEIVEHLHSQLGFRPGRVYLVRPKTIARTPNGKLRRFQLREQFLAGELHRSAAILYPQHPLMD